VKDTAESGCSNEKYQEQWIVDVMKTVVKKQMALMIDMDRLCRDGKQSLQERAFNFAQHFFGSFTAYQADAEPTAEIINTLVKAVYVFSNDRIEVNFSFMDGLEQAMLDFEGVSTGL
jgi:hypothetical protein